MNTLFAPMVVKYNTREYVTVGVVTPSFATTFKFKIEKKTLEDTEANVIHEGPTRVEFILQPISKEQYQKNFEIVPAIHCEFVRFVDQCLMCRSPKMDEGG